jgi:hypothetical protein
MGSCQPYPNAGESCKETRRCAGDSYCAFDGIVCKPLPRIGEACGIDSVTQKPEACAPDAVCDGQSGSEVPLCKAKADVGEACRPYEIECRAGLSCLCLDTLCQTQECWKVRMVGESCGGPGEKCHPASTCEGGVCVAIESQSIFSQVCK